MDEFIVCQHINELLSSSDGETRGIREKEARNEMIKLLNYLEQQDIPYSPMVNHFIRELGLYPYLQTETADWQERYIFEAFKVDTGDGEHTLHREQSALLKHLIEGEDIAVSAPTSFGKSFVIDAFISLKNPNIVMIIVPTIALADETRRRLQKKFANRYKIITTADSKLSEKNIFIFPQERALSYIDKITDIDILIVDEFYKAAFDKERSPSLLKAILEFRIIAKQCYFLAPNIQSIKENVFTNGMQFVPLDFNTVYSDIDECYRESAYAQDKENFKKEKLVEILKKNLSKTLIYAGTYTNIDSIINILNESFQYVSQSILKEFSEWLQENYGRDYVLADIIKKGIGIHNGRLHRSLSQIQIRLFEENEALNTIVSTSSIIEGVNTVAENVIIWSDKNGTMRINDFTYKNIIGRGGRMFKHFVGKIFLLEPPPIQQQTQLEFGFSDELAALLPQEKHNQTLTREQEIKIIAFQEEMDGLIGRPLYRQLTSNNKIQSLKPDGLRSVIRDMKNNPNSWHGFSYLNASDSSKWENTLFHTLKFAGYVGGKHSDFVHFIRVLSNNWHSTIPSIISNLRSCGVTIEKFFELERYVAFSFSALLSDINEIYNCMFTPKVDVSSFILKVSNAFLPKLVYELEEYGMPRMLSKKIRTRSRIFSLLQSKFQNATIDYAKVTK